jgi:hypothetical protein
MADDLCPPAPIDKILAKIFDAPLSSVGFKNIRPRFYVRTRLPEMNDVIEFYRNRFDLVLVSGPSLNFVPHITGGVENIRWHRTPKSACIDLRYSGFDKHSQIEWSIQTRQGAQTLSRSAQLTLVEVLPKALAYFESIRVFSDLSAKFRDSIATSVGWTLEMRYQEHLAYCFYLAKSGQETEARKMMSAWLSRGFNSFRPETLESCLSTLKKRPKRRLRCSEAAIALDKRRYRSRVVSFNPHPSASGRKLSEPEYAPSHPEHPGCRNRPCNSDENSKRLQI